MLGAKKSPVASHSLKTQDKTAVHAYLFSFLSSNGNGDHFYRNKKLLMIIRTR